jgi:hypothetical protein
MINAHKEHNTVNIAYTKHRLPAKKKKKKKSLTPNIGRGHCTSTNKNIGREKWSALTAHSSQRSKKYHYPMSSDTSSA